MSNVLEDATREFVKARECLLEEMWRAGVTCSVLADGTVVEWDEGIGLGGELYTYQRRGLGYGEEKEATLKEEENEEDKGESEGAAFVCPARYICACPLCTWRSDIDF